MKCIKRIRPALIGVSVFLCSCLTGCSLSFCGIGTPKEEFVFYCDTEPERTEKTEKTEETEQKEQELPEEQRQSVHKLIEKLEEDDDVVNVFHNMKEEEE